MSDTVFSSVAALAADIRSKRISAIEALDAFLAQIDRHNRTLNAVVTINAERAIDRAREADAALARGESWGPLHGVPFTLKDCHSTAGMRTTAGFPAFKSYVPRKDGTVAARLIAAGGVLIGKTNVPTMLADFQTSNPIFGRTNNPWNVERTPGGSSGGAAAAVAAGLSAFDVGTDLAGSVRVPAHFCGVFGLKATERRIPQTGVVPDPPDSPRSLRVMASLGPIARTVDDIALLFGLLAGPDGRDTEVPPVPVEAPPTIRLKDLRIAVAPNYAGFPLAAQVRAAVESLAKSLAPQCAALDETQLPEVSLREQGAVGGEVAGMAIGAFQPGNDAPTTLPDYLEALHRRDVFIAAWERFFDSWDVLLCPPAMTTAFAHCNQGDAISVDGKKAEYWMANAHSQVFNTTGNPAIVMPYALDADGLPVGVQLVTRRWDESRLLAIAKAVSEATGEFRRPPGF